MRMTAELDKEGKLGIEVMKVFKFTEKKLKLIFFSFLFFKKKTYSLTTTALNWRNASKMDPLLGWNRLTRMEMVVIRNWMNRSKMRPTNPTIGNWLIDWFCQHVFSSFFISSSSFSHRFHFVYWIFIIHGIGTLMPWNMFMTAKSVSRIWTNSKSINFIHWFPFPQYYTDYKLNFVMLDSAQEEVLADYRSRFLSIAGVSSQIPNLVFSGLNLLLAYYASAM